MTDTMTLDLLHGIQEIAQFLNVTPRTAEYWIQKKHIPVVRIGRTVCARRHRLVEALDAIESANNDCKYA
jgi:excisionase family DNA binding protein